jgi:hypothetical protein
MKRLSAFSVLLGTLLLLLVPAAGFANAATQFAATSQSSHAPLMGCGSGTSGNYNVTATVGAYGSTYGKFVGNKDWGQEGSRPPQYHIDINGHLYSYHGTTQLFVQYTYCGATYHAQVASANAGQTILVAKNPMEYNLDIGGYSNVKLYVCNNYNGYRCGAEV